jgi:hypothetical protein
VRVEDDARLLEAAPVQDPVDGDLGGDEDPEPLQAAGDLPAGLVGADDGRLLDAVDQRGVGPGEGGGDPAQGQGQPTGGDGEGEGPRQDPRELAVGGAEPLLQFGPEGEQARTEMDAGRPPPTAVWDSHPGQDQKAAVGHHPLQIAPPRRLVPPDPGLPRRHPPGRTGKLQARHDSPHWLRGVRQVAQLGAIGHRVAQVVVAPDELHSSCCSAVRTISSSRGARSPTVPTSARCGSPRAVWGTWVFDPTGRPTCFAGSRRGQRRRGAPGTPGTPAPSAAPTGAPSRATRRRCGPAPSG